LTQFGEQTTSDLQDALKRMKAQGMQGLIMDLRNNPGGLLP
jgi:carboxyl-terminal processing protease